MVVYSGGGVVEAGIILEHKISRHSRRFFLLHSNDVEQSRVEAGFRFTLKSEEESLGYVTLVFGEHGNLILTRSKGEGRERHRVCVYPVGTTLSKARSLVSENAIAAYRYHGYPRVSRFPWLTSPIGPRETLMYISNGPRHFALEWIRLVSVELSSIELFTRLPSCIVDLIIDISFRLKSLPSV